MGKGGGGQADQSGMYMAMASAQAAQLEYKLGQEQLDWAKQVWSQEQPLITQSEQLQMQVAQQDLQAQQQAETFAQNQEREYLKIFQPLQEKYATEAQNWASPANMALYMGQAQGNVAESMNNSLNTAKEQLQAYGVNPDAPRMAGLYVGQNALGGAAMAGAGTSTAMNLRQQQMGLEANALNMGLGIGNQSAQLTNAATGAGTGGIQGGAGAAGTAQSNLSTGSNAMIAPTAYFNSAANNMGVYVNAVNGFNDAQAKIAEANASESSGMGSILGGALGMLKFAPITLNKGGPVVGYNQGGYVGYDDGGDISPYLEAQMMQSQEPDVQDATPQRPVTAIPPSPGATDATPGGMVPSSASPSGGQTPDDVPSLLTAGEFVMPRDVSQHLGHKALTNMVDKARQEMAQIQQRDDIGGEQVRGIPPAPPKFVSRPMQTASTATLSPMLPIRGMSGIPQQQQQQYA